MAKRVNNNWLIFVDTNILLDFYRKDGADAVKQIEALERHKERLVLTDQVFMEFLKNRQAVIAATIRDMKRPDVIKLPPVLRDFTTAATLDRDIKSAVGKFNKMNERVRKVLTEPKRHDKVYKGLSQIFETKSEFFLKRDASERFSVRRLAQKRFFLGYPPRKSGDTSIGDSLNWEWIVNCARRCPRSSHVMIVSRDGDYGYRSDKSSYLNDWLDREFKERVGKERQIILTARLTDALKKLNESVTNDEIAREAEVIENSPYSGKADLLSILRRGKPNGYLALDSEILREFGTSQAEIISELQNEGFDPKIFNESEFLKGANRKHKSGSSLHLSYPLRQLCTPSTVCGMGGEGVRARSALPQPFPLSPDMHRIKPRCQHMVIDRACHLPHAP